MLGTSQLEVTPGQGPELVFVWHNLDEPLVFTFSRSQGKTRRSLLERYDHEHAFRVKVADNARRVTGADDDPQPLVEPIGQDECRRCPYEQWCARQMGEDDPSAAITIGRLGTREWLTLRRMGVTTTAALSAVDPDDPVFFDEYIAEVSHLTRDQARKRLAAAIERAEMICDGIEIKRTGDGPVEVPVADVEIDVDIEYDLDNRVYMWGARLRRGTDDSSAQYFADFVEWDPLDSQRERALAARFAAWLRGQRDAADAAGQTLKVFHWSHPERSKLKSILGLAEVGDLIDPETGVFVDLEKVFKANFVSLHGSSIKKVAPALRVHLAGRRSRWRDLPDLPVQGAHQHRPRRSRHGQGVAADLQRGRQRGHGQDPRRHEALDAVMAQAAQHDDSDREHAELCVHLGRDGFRWNDGADAGAAERELHKGNGRADNDGILLRSRPSRPGRTGRTR